MIETGIYGGSFNPIHNGHIALASQLLGKAGLDEILFIVSPQNPLKAQTSLLADDLRLDMTRRALAPYPALTVSDFEFHLPKPSYMWHTLQAMSREWPDRRLHLIIGADNWAVFDKWFCAADIIRTYPIIIYPRDGYPMDTTQLPPTVRLVNTPLYDISSTEIRADIAAGRSIEGKVPQCIINDATEAYQSFCTEPK